MKEVDIRFDPYRMETVLKIDSCDVCNEDSPYEGFKQFVETGTPLQTWVEPIVCKNWKGFLDEICDMERNDNLIIRFKGREIDWVDFHRSVDEQNHKRSKKTRVEIDYSFEAIFDDNELARKIDSVVKDIKSKRFARLVGERSSDSLKEYYDAMEENYQKACDSEFIVLFSGMYSSGKSTLINAIIGHEILPTSDATTTSKICEIRHNSEFKDSFLFICYDKEKKEILREVLSDDESCKKKIQELSLRSKGETQTQNYSVESFRIETDISHLYPESLDNDNLNLVLVDTPGINSAKSREKGENYHKQLTLDAINNECKPMIVFCANARQEYEDSIGEFMGDILKSSNYDNGGFNDRFIFVLNQGDTRQYNENETIQETKKDYFEYLTESSKWGQEFDTVNFVPRVFFTSAYVHEAICKGVSTSTLLDRKKDPVMKSRFIAYRAMMENIIEYNDENYYLSSNSDIPAYRKKEIEEVFEFELEQGNESEATQLQCGVNALQIAIKDYIERYAYPIKVRALLDSFEAILKDVSEFASAEYMEFDKKRKELGETKGERREEKKRVKAAEDKETKLNKLNEIVSEQQKKLQGIVFDNDALVELKVDFDKIIENTDIVKEIRSHNHYTKPKKNEIEEIEKKKIQSLNNCFEKAKKHANVEIEKIKIRYDKIISEIYGVLGDVKERIIAEDLLNINGYDFSKNIIWQKDFSRVNQYTIERAKEDTVYTEGRLFDGVFILEHLLGWIHDEKNDTYSFNMDCLAPEVEKHLEEFQKHVDSLAESFSKGLKKKKDNTGQIINAIVKEMKNAEKDFNNAQERISNLSVDVNALTKEVERLRRDSKWLNGIKEKLEGTQ